MKRAFLAVLLALAWTLPVYAAKKKSTHEQIARYAAVIGSNRLVDDAHDYRGHLLLRFALVLMPGNEIALAAKGSGEWSDWSDRPGRIQTEVTEEKLYSVIASQANSLRLKEWPRNAKAGQLALLYYRMAERARPDDEAVRLGLRELRAKGIDGDLDRALERTSSLKGIFGRPTRRPAVARRTEEARRRERGVQKAPYGITALDRMAVAFVGGYSKAQIKSVLDHTMKLYGVPITEDNYFLYGTILVALRVETEGTTEMKMLAFAVKAHAPGVKLVTLKDALVLAATFTGNSD